MAVMRVPREKFESMQAMTITWIVITNFFLHKFRADVERIEFLQKTKS